MRLSAASRKHREMLLRLLDQEERRTTPDDALNILKVLISFEYFEFRKENNPSIALVLWAIFCMARNEKVFLIDWLVMFPKYLNRSIGCGRFCQAISTLCEGRLGHISNIKKAAIGHGNQLDVRHHLVVQKAFHSFLLVGPNLN